MRKITTKPKNNRRNQLILGIILIFIMLGSTLGIIVDSFGKEKISDKELIYNGFTFTQQNNLWFNSKDNLNFVFSYNPTEVEKINSKINPLEKYLGKPLYVVSKNKEAETEIFRNLDPNANPIVQRIRLACLDESECEGNYPIKTCDDNLIIIQESNETSITQEQNCVFIQGNNTDLKMLTDVFLFKTIGIEE